MFTTLPLENTIINTTIAIPVPAIGTPIQLADVKPNPMAMGNQAKNMVWPPTPYRLFQQAIRPYDRKIFIRFAPWYIIK